MHIMNHSNNFCQYCLRFNHDFLKESSMVSINQNNVTKEEDVVPINLFKENFIMRYLNDECLTIFEHNHQNSCKYSIFQKLVMVAACSARFFHLVLSPLSYSLIALSRHPFLLLQTHPCHQNTFYSIRCNFCCNRFFFTFSPPQQLK